MQPLIAYSFAAALALVAAGCSSGEEKGSGVEDPVEPGRTPPPDPGMPEASGTTATTLGVTSILLGDTAPDGTPDPTYWMNLGYNLDGIVSTKEGTNHCKPIRGAPAIVKIDGKDGIDNSFGSSLMSVITSVAADASPSLNASILSGDFTVVFHFENMDDSATQAGIAASLLGGGVHMAMGVCENGSDAPCFDGTDAWPITAETVNGGDVDDAKVKFPTSYMVDGTWVSGTLGDLDLAVTIEMVTFVLRIHDALISMDIEGRGTDAKATNGVIAGLIITDELIADLREVAGALDVSLCDGPTFDGIARQVRAASDIMDDGTNGDSSVTCNAISVGLGFNATGITRGPVQDPVTPPDNPCPM